MLTAADLKEGMAYERLGATNQATVTAATAVSSTCLEKTAPKSQRSLAAGLFRVRTSRTTCCLP